MNNILDKYLLFESQDLDHTRQQVANVFCDHRLELQKGSHIKARHHHFSLSNISLSLLEYGGEVFVDPGEMDEFIMLQMPIRGKAKIKCGRESIVVHPGVASASAPKQPLTIHWGADCQMLIVQLNRKALEKHLSSLLVRPLREPLTFEPIMAAHKNTTPAASWWRSIRHLAEEVSLNEDFFSIEACATSTEQTVMTNLLFAQHHNYADALERDASPAIPRYIKIAEAFISAHADEDITVEDLAEITGVSIRSLYGGFRRFRNTTPMNYLRSVRLKKAYHDLKQADSSQTVTDIATRWGFTQLGRFSVMYKSVFGESPSETLNR